MGNNPVLYAWSSTGCITKKVRNRASPIRTVFGGVDCAPIADRSSDSTMTIRVKPVTMTSALGAIESTVMSAVSWTNRPVAPA